MLKINTIKSMFSKNTNKVAEAVTKKATVVTKPAANNTNGAEALANQGRAMVHGAYQKPEATVIKLNRPPPPAASGINQGAGGGDHNYGDLAKESPEWFDSWGNNASEGKLPSSRSLWD